jgi:hypothetical protein
MATKKPMKKVKRYEGGGEIEEAAAKQRGLDISNKEKPMGFFERLRAGNIDDPSSEAYKRFGAGRGRATAPAESKPTPAQTAASAASAASDRSLSDDMYSDFGPRSGRSSSDTVTPTRSTATKPVAPAKAPQVTKAELEKSGLSLRDYMNKQQGLTRKESAKESVKASVKAAMPDAEILEAKRVARYTPPGSAPKQSMGRQRQPFMPGEVDNTFPGAKFKGGGKVRSASARADGIAIRGKTRA